MASKKNKKTEVHETFQNLQKFEEFLPKPDELVYKEETIKVTLNLTKNSISFFKAQAKRHKTQYQKMIKGLLDHYVALFEKE